MKVQGTRLVCEYHECDKSAGTSGWCPEHTYEFAYAKLDMERELERVLTVHARFFEFCRKRGGAV